MIKASKILVLDLVVALSIFFISLPYAHCQSTTNPQPDAAPKRSPSAGTQAPRLDLHKALSITDLKIEMAESTWKVRQTLPVLAELANALEGYLNQNCFGNMPQTLAYAGPPTNPDCIARMERLLDLYPNNPVATCLRDGIEAQSCSDAYRGQSMKQFVPSSSVENTPDPALRVGLSAQDNEKLKAINETLSKVNTDYQSATTNVDKQKHTDDAMHLYDQALSIACKIVALQLEDPLADKNAAAANREDSSVREVREKLLKIPPALRADYQNKLMTEAEEELARAKDSPSKRQIALQKIAAIQDPDTKTIPTSTGKIRYRVVLPECYDLVGKASVLLPNLPSPTCHRDGWQSPQCIQAIKKWHAYRAQVEERKRKTEKRAVPTAGSQISSF